MRCLRSLLALGCASVINASAYSETPDDTGVSDQDVEEWLFSTLRDLDEEPTGKKRQRVSYTADHSEIVKAYAFVETENLRSLHAWANAEMVSSGLCEMKYPTFVSRVLRLRSLAEGNSWPQAPTRNQVHFTADHEAILRKYAATDLTQKEIQDVASAEMSAKGLQVLSKHTIRASVAKIRGGEPLMPRVLFNQDHAAIMRSHLRTGASPRLQWPRVRAAIEASNLPPLTEKAYYNKARSIRRELGFA